MFDRKSLATWAIPLLGFALTLTACLGSGQPAPAPSTPPATVSHIEALEDVTPQVSAGADHDALEGTNPAPARLPADKYEALEIVTLLPRDGIPAVDNPQFLTAAAADDYYDPDELVIGVDFGGEARAYSVPFLSNHEIVNDTAGGVKIAVTW